MIALVPLKGCTYDRHREERQRNKRMELTNDINKLIMEASTARNRASKWYDWHVHLDQMNRENFW